METGKRRIFYYADLRKVKRTVKRNRSCAAPLASLRISCPMLVELDLHCYTECNEFAKERDKETEGAMQSPGNEMPMSQRILMEKQRSIR